MGRCPVMPVLENYKILIHSLRNIHRELGFNWISNFLEGITYTWKFFTARVVILVRGPQ